jgi:hypothetical protein
MWGRLQAGSRRFPFQAESQERNARDVVRVELCSVFCYSFENGPLKLQLCCRAFGYWRRNIIQAPDKHAQHNLSFESASKLYVNHEVLRLVHRVRTLAVTLLTSYCRKHCSRTSGRLLST